MDSNTNIRTLITPAARRVARQVNAAPQGFVSAYDADGQAFATWAAGSWSPDEKHPGAGALVHAHGLRGSGSRMTWREAQDLIDATAYQAAGRGSIGDYLEDLEFQRERASH